MLTYCKTLKFVEKPDYSMLQKCLKEIATQNHIEFDGVFDWTNNPAANAKIVALLPTQEEIERVRGTSILLKAEIKYAIFIIMQVTS